MLKLCTYNYVYTHQYNPDGYTRVSSLSEENTPFASALIQTIATIPHAAVHDSLQSIQHCSHFLSYYSFQ